MASYWNFRPAALAALFLGWTFQAFAQNRITYTAVLHDSLAEGKSLPVQDTLFYSTARKSVPLRANKVENLVCLRFREFSRRVFPDSFRVRLMLRVIYTDRNQRTDSLDNIRLELEYGKQGAYKGLDIFPFRDAHSLQVRVVKLTAEGAPLAAIAPLLELENRMVVDRQYELNCTADAIRSLSADGASVAETGELKVYWTPSAAAQAYDLEWTFLEKSVLASGRYATDGKLNPALVFQSGSSRVTVRGSSYLIPLLYDGEGELFCRVRAVQTGPGGELLTTGWSSEHPSGLVRYRFSGHEKGLNWQATTTFAEDGKRKSVVQYFDGSLRARQVVTRDNMAGTTVVAETFYDKQGRPVIQVMPAPTLNKLLQFTPGLNAAHPNSREYDKGLYDTLTSMSDYCASGADSMTAASGAALYYSPWNPLKEQGIHRFIPDARGYVFSETRYTADATGRIARQGGVGKELRIGSGHETKYYYSIPEQADLDALFGTEAGDATHYGKTVVRDANGQYSVSYTDLQGRTIATALAGAPPASMARLDSFRDSVQTDYLLPGAANLLDGTSLNATKSITLTRGGAHVFRYRAGKERLSLEDCRRQNVCFDCLYDLTITVTDDCNNSLLGGQPVVISKRNFPAFRVDTSCGLAVPMDTSFRLTLPEGSYTISRVLSISKQGMDYLRDSIYLPRFTCLSYEDFLEEELAEVKKRMKDCNVQEPDLSTHKAYRQQMLYDLLPVVGQYADTAAGRGCFSIFDPTGAGYRYQQPGLAYRDEAGQPDQVTGSNGQSVSPQALSPEDFILHFRESWLEALLPLHPEFPLLQQYERLAESLTWDEEFEGTATFAEALAKGFLNPTGNTDQLLVSRFPATNTDPLFGYIFGGSARASLEDSLFRLQVTGDPEVPVISAWGLATVLAKCPDVQDKACTIQWSAVGKVFDTSGLCVGELDRAWLLFRRIYSEKKREWIDRFIRRMSGMDPLTPLCNPVFASREQGLAAAGYHLWDKPDTASVNNRSRQVYSENCHAYTQMWWQQLEPCGYTKEQSALVTAYLEEVCRQGADDRHPYGASSVAPGSMYRFRSFEDVIKFVNDSLGRATDIHCNAYLIDKPLPYGEQMFPIEEKLYSRPDDCVCRKIDSLYSRYLSVASAYTGFSGYVLRKLGAAISEGALDSLRRLCSGDISCKFIPTPLTLPPALACGVKNACIDCRQWTEAKTLFRQQFPGAEPTYEEPDTLQQRNNRVFANFLNQRFGFTKTPADYLDFERRCQEGGTEIPGEGNETLEQLLKDFREWYAGQQYQGYRITAGAHALVEGANAVVRLLNNNPLPLGYAKAVASGDFTAKLRSVISKRSGKFHAIVPLPLDYTLTNHTKDKPPLNNLWSNTVSDTDFIAGPVTADQLNAKYFATVIFNDGNLFGQIWNGQNSGSYSVIGVSPPLKKYLPEKVGKASNNVYYFVFFRLPSGLKSVATYDSLYNYFIVNIDTARKRLSPYTIDNRHVKSIRDLRFDPEFVDASDRYFKSSSKGLKVTLDLRDGTTTDAYMGGYYYWAPYVIFKEQVDSSSGPADCQKSFVSYFNQRQGTQYSAQQVDSVFGVYYRLPFNPCSDTLVPLPISAVTLCGKNDALEEAVPDLTGPCSDSTSIAILKATERYRRYRDSLIAGFNEAYTQKCLQGIAYESFTLTHPVSEYHYTLYYYDRAGNLVKTVPPEGAHPNRNPQWLEQVRQRRAAGERQVPEHSLATVYRHNSLGAVVSQSTPDAGISRFWYDRLGRLAVSQNAKQKAGEAWSYTLYDGLGRITEVGEKLQPTALSSAISRNPEQLQQWLSYTYSLDADRKGLARQVVRTVYDEADEALAMPLPIPVHQKSYTLRGRVSYVRFYENLAVNSSGKILYNEFDNSATYSYDIHGNVDTLLHHYRTGLMAQHGLNRFKVVAYKYDLISGKVSEVHFQPGERDQLYHRYDYDADNRLTDVYTTDHKELLGQAGLEDHDAHYQYYKHGPLARAVLGGRQVQGMDYAYTLQGWLKGVNSTALDPMHDMGADGTFTARDAFGFSLNYYTGDFAPIQAKAAPFPGHSAFLPTGEYRPLYNGNISSMAVNIAPLKQPQLYNYRFDQLNRLVAMDAYRGLDEVGNSWKALTLTQDHQERIRYDANGNILSYFRNGSASGAQPLAMDNLKYGYNRNASGQLVNNRLRHVKDGVSATNYKEDIDDQPDDNYDYDAIGNLVKDKAGKIDKILWTVYGKIARIEKVGVKTGDVKSITYSYDPSGNRISKKVEYLNKAEKQTAYVRDAQGNVLAVYEQEGSGPLLLSEQHLYGNSRLGMWRRGVDMDKAEEKHSTWGSSAGSKIYEGTDHRGNVMVVFTDRKIPIDLDKDGLVDYWAADIVSAMDYTPFGAPMVTRPGNNAEYRYGYNGKENDREVFGEGNLYDYGDRIYNSRVGRWLSLDAMQKKYPNESNYVFVSNSPLLFKDPDGKDKIVTIYMRTSIGLFPVLQISDKDFFYAEMQSKFNGGYDYVKYNVNETYIMDFSKGGLTKSSKVDFSNPTYDIGFLEYFQHKTHTYGLLKDFFGKSKSKSIQEFGYVLTGNTGTTIDLEGADAKYKEHLDITALLGTFGGMKDMPGVEGFNSLLEELKKAKEVIGEGSKVLNALLNTAEKLENLGNAGDGAHGAAEVNATPNYTYKPNSTVCAACGESNVEHTSLGRLRTDKDGKVKDTLKKNLKTGKVDTIPVKK
ncbi:RHS repeat-associated core domain-containing protein [Paraflavisolibacter sp. H34]|uniref:RHS repeat domain-containing protein n=1 Tax=Huijunlia imazamoxiresistens TaxID=3127457 RepID=UPI003015A6BE